MPKFRKRPVEIEAVLFDGSEESLNQVLKFTLKKYFLDTNPFNGVTSLFLETLEGNMHVSPGDWVIKGVEGEFYPCKPGIFEKTYDLVEPLRPLPIDASLLAELPVEDDDEYECHCFDDPDEYEDC